jgi:hypothetical protein
MKLSQVNRYQIISSQEINEDRIKQAVEIDENTYSTEFKGVLELCISWFKKNQDIYTFVIDKQTDQVVGYLNAMPLDENTINKIESGTSKDNAIKPENIFAYDRPGFYKLYLCSIAVDPEYHGTIVFKLLFDALFGNLLALAVKEIMITDMIADAVTNEGAKICEFIGMKKINSTKHGTSIYKTTIFPPTFRTTTESTKKLFTYIQEKEYHQ